MWSPSIESDFGLVLQAMRVLSRATWMLPTARFTLQMDELRLRRARRIFESVHTSLRNCPQFRRVPFLFTQEMFPNARKVRRKRHLSGARKRNHPLCGACWNANRPPWHASRRVGGRRRPRSPTPPPRASRCVLRSRAQEPAIQPRPAAGGHGGCLAMPCARSSAAHQAAGAAPCSAAYNSGEAKCAAPKARHRGTPMGDPAAPPAARRTSPHCVLHAVAGSPRARRRKPSHPSRRGSHRSPRSKTSCGVPPLCECGGAACATSHPAAFARRTAHPAPPPNRVAAMRAALRAGK